LAELEEYLEDWPLVRSEGLQRWEAIRATLLRLLEHRRRELPFAEFLYQ